MNEVNPQKELFESMHDLYREHFFSSGALHWKKKMVWDYIKKFNIDLNDKVIGEFFCGSGFNSQEILKNYQPERIVGFDISENAVNDFKKLTNQDAFQCDLSKEFNFEGNTKFDHIFVFGGLHHAYFCLDQVIKNISKFLKDGGTLIVFEPLRNTFWDFARNFWYKHDKFFDETSEYALIPTEVEKHQLEMIGTKYITGPGYLLVYNSMILRVPILVANFISIPLTLVDQLFSYLGLSFFSFCFVGIYQKRK